MRALWVVLCLAAGPAFGQTAEPLDAEAFDRLTLGKKMDTFEGSERYGTEEFLRGHRSLWQDAEGCMRASWEQVGDQICFRYDGRPGKVDCWIYTYEQGEIRGHLEGNMDSAPIRLVPGNHRMSCDYLGA